jgi:hypothetical protein
VHNSRAKQHMAATVDIDLGRQCNLDAIPSPSHRLCFCNVYAGDDTVDDKIEVKVTRNESYLCDAL